MNLLIKKFVGPLVTFSVSGLVGVQPLLAQSITTAPDGTGTIVSPNGNTYNITGGTVSGQNLFHSFQQFGLNSGEIANFLSNPNIDNILGRVVGGDPSIINGQLQVIGGNSNLYLMNPAGMIFGPGASLNVPASFTATTADSIGFAGGRFNAMGANNYNALVGSPNSFAFSSSQPGSLVNAGNLAVGQGQNVTLLGGTTVNTGTISAPGGNITIAAIPGQQNLVRISQNGMLLSLEVEPSSAGVAARSLPQLLTGGNLEQAIGLKANPDGTVSLTNSTAAIPTTPGTAIASGTLNVSGTTAGSVNVLGNQVNVIGANINASGTNGGGTVLIGGDYKGTGTVPNAKNTTVTSDSVINANAQTNGNGGKVIVWADETTRFNGSISARGGAQSGDGGFVETSGKLGLNTTGASVDAGAINGQAGSWLLDPLNIIVQAGGTATLDQVADATDTTSTAIIDPAIINSANANVILAATNDITFASPISMTNAGVGLTANAGNAIALAQNIATNNGAVALNAPTINLNAIVTTGTAALTGNATNVNVTTAGRVQNAVDVAANNATINLGAGTFADPAVITIANKSLTFLGGRSGNTIVSGSNAHGVFNITNADVTFDSLTIADGNTGFSGNGGGINHTGSGTLTVLNSTITNNTALNGGGISRTRNGGDQGFANITNSTISGNGSFADGGGVYINGVFNATLTNVTVTNNTADLDGNGYGDGGGIFKPQTSGAVFLRNTIVAGNRDNSGTAGSQINIPDVGGVYGFSGTGNNLIGVTDGSQGLYDPNNASFLGSLANPIDPRLAPLANNGGPAPTHALLPDSPAINAGSNTVAAAIDQRGGQRVGGLNSGANVDIGAYEATSSYLVTNTRDDIGLGTLRSAINFANTNINPIVNTTQQGINFNISNGGAQTIALTSALPTLTPSVIIDGTTQPGFAGTPLIQLNGTNAGVGVNGLTLTAGNNIVQGLAINGFSGNGIELNTNGNNIIRSNFISANSLNGVFVNNVAGNTIEGNLISGNTGNGVLLSGSNTLENKVRSNFIGTNAAGTALGNTGNGVLIENGASNNTIGGITVGEGNAIAYNAKGVVVTGDTSTGNRINGNSIFANTSSGIDIGNDGTTANSLNSAGANNGQTYPLLLTANDTTVSGLLNSTPNTTYRLEFFASSTSDQGQTFLGSTTVTTDSTGLANFSADVSAIPAGQVVTATSTNLITGSTSEFAATPGVSITPT
ncbi:MAG TPA: filamentous hemagglutinin N-terminal domain-containing protein, partial [Coleofasciculaceae cyanobacterium]